MTGTDTTKQGFMLDEAAQGVIGTPMDRPDGPLKVSGAATYAHEWNLPGTAHGVLVRATIAHGRLDHVNATSIADIDGLLGVYSGPRFLRNPAQGGAEEAPVQGVDIEYFGQPVALVVAETFEAARDGAMRIQLRMEADDSGVFDPANSPAEPQEDEALEQGDLDQAMQDAAHAIDVTYTTPGHNSAAMEPHCSIAHWQDGRLTLRGSYQMLKYNKMELADALDIDPARVRVLSPYVGGGFGSKLGLAPEALAAAIAARDLDRPVVVALSRQQVFEVVMRRSESTQRVRLAASEDGTLTGLGHSGLVSNLPGESFAEPLLQATRFLYGGQNRTLSLGLSRVNRLCAGSVRAPGEAIGMQVLENAMDELACAADIDPVELRLRNIPERHPETGIPFASRKLAQALQQGAESFGWNRRQTQTGACREGEWLIGMGMATAARVNWLSKSAARVTLKTDGTALVETDMTDIGTGTYAILTQIAAEMLGLTPGAVTTTLGDTDLPAAAGSGGSWGASSSGSSVFLACQEIRKDIARQMGCTPEDLTLKNGTAVCGNRSTPLTDLLTRDVCREATVKPDKAMKDKQSASYGAHFCEVAVNAVTGETRVRRMLGVFGAGRILNEKTARSQCIGAMTWGIGMALHEDLMFDLRDGHLTNRDLAEYHIPVNLDVPHQDVIFIEERDDDASPIQAKGLGELGICGAAAAVTNAIYNACGVRVREYPATVDKIITGLA
ncbi:xanthine dehydrogenase family protein molybdopterin-binding subunit [Croceicoccus sp. F390]|uniref:Xanthine dehydrogenase family protein molybdopterin-binding subunit n=1 Tax=Croceicoccus esteveae TaxID=3075597 RepID=A0ABU2ZJ61_9SPHN|nr:xanthine dehydrogenase family protein molybdopterin-binding subunit [Croceicoccus sp. F390]MDT0575447.1 xanthine dehydrogenase family protein molybdopterin-binding subunit [Croceicoccus sp. F390]